MKAAGLEYLERGEGEAVVFLHGIGGAAESFEGQLEGMGFGRRIAVNLPGYGASEAMDVMRFEAISARLSEFLKALEVSAAHLVGQSIGGMIALDHALRAPGEVKSLALIGTTPAFGGRDDSFKEAFLKARLAPLEAGQSMEEMAKAAAPQLVGPAADAAVMRRVAAPLARVSEATWRSILDCLVTFNRREDLGRVEHRVCLIAGSHDQNAPARTMEKMAAKIEGSSFHLLEGAGHMINQERVEETNQILDNFLRAKA